MTVLELTDPRWKDFVGGHPAATPFHHPNWGRLIADCYRFRAFALAATDAAGTIRAGLPMVEVRHLQGRPKWVSLPFTDYCPPLVSTQQEEVQLVSALQEASDAVGVRRVEIRGPLEGVSAMPCTALRHVLALDGGEARVYEGFHRSQVQRSIRRAEGKGLTIRQAADPHDLHGTFYGLHTRTRRRQGVPVQPRRFFRLLWERIIDPGFGSALIAEASGRPVAAAVFLAWRDTVIYKFGASDTNAWSLRPNHLLFWHAIRTACEEGSRWFDFGRTDADQEGLRSFKRSWGAVEKPLVYRALGSGTERTPATQGLTARMLEQVIRHSPPLLCRATGEMLYRYTA